MKWKKTMLLMLAGLTLSAPFANAQWRTCAGDRRLSVKSPAPYQLYSLLRNRMLAGQELEAVIETPSGGWLVIGNNFFQVAPGHSIPASLAYEIATTHSLGRRIDDVAFDREGDWVLVAGNRVRTGGGIQGTCVSRLLSVTGVGHRVRSVAFDPDGTGWVIATDHQVYYSYVPTHLGAALSDCRKGKRSVRQVRFGASNGNGWIITTDRWSVTSEGYGGPNGPSLLTDELAQFKSLGRLADEVAPIGEGWVVYASGALPAPTSLRDQFLTDIGGKDIVTRMGELNIPGVSIALIKDKRIDWVRGYGVLENGEDAVVNTTTRFPAASLSKAVTAMTALSVVEDGLVDLDEGLLSIVCDYNNAVDFQSLFGQWVWQNFGPATQIDDVSLRMLLSHTGGLNVHGIGLRSQTISEIGGIQLMWPMANPRGLRDELIWTMFSQAYDDVPQGTYGSARVTLIHQPATMYDYSGGGFCAAEALIEAATQQSFAVNASARIFGPLGMIRSTFSRHVNQNGLAHGHNSNGSPIDHRYCPGKAAGGLTTTAEDYARFLCCLALDGRRHADASWSDRVLDWYTTRWIMMQGVYDSNGNRIPRSNNTYPALGLVASSTPEYGRPRFLEHGGTQSGFRNFFRVHPYRGEGFVVFINAHTDAGGETLRQELLASFDNTYIN